ncbi:MAG: hydrolase, partial [Frankiales bacterium]|nr:hydrolase [Frankiales bacterium]
AGRVEPGESRPDAARREVLEETGWQPGPLTPWTSWHPSNGSSDQEFEIFGAEGARYVGEPSDPSESERIAWVPADQVAALLRDGAVHDGMTTTALLWWIAMQGSAT